MIPEAFRFLRKSDTFTYKRWGFFSRSELETERPRSCASHPLSSRSLGIPDLFGLAGRGKGRAGYDLMSLRKRRADGEAAEASW